MKTIDGIPKKEKVDEKLLRKKRALLETTKNKMPEFGVSSENMKIQVKKIERKPEIEDFAVPRKKKKFDLEMDVDDLNDISYKSSKGKEIKVKTEKKKDKKKVAKKIIVGLIILAIGGGAIGVLGWGENLMRKITGGKSGVIDAVGSVLSEKETELKKDEHGRINFLLFGTSGYDEEGTDDHGNKHDGAALTDSIMVLSLDQEKKDMLMLSIPRDLKTDGTCTATGKINELYWCGNMTGKNERAGAKALQSEIEKITNQKMQYYAHVNWGALVKVVDAIGGITVTLDETVNDTLYTKAYVEKGVPTQLNGKQALDLARARHGTEGGDFTRANSQQKIIMAIYKKITEKNLGISEIFNLINVMGDNLKTDLTIDELKAAAKIGRGIDLQSMRQVSLTDWKNGQNFLAPATLGGISYVIPKKGINEYTEIQEYIAKEFSGDLAHREHEKILVLNASGIAGKAASERVKLEGQNFNVVNVGDTTAKHTQEYTIYVLNENMASTQKKLEDFYGVKAQTKEQIPAEISVDGIDFVVVIGNKN